MRRSPGLLELNWPVPMRINTIRAAPIIATTAHSVGDFPVVGVEGIDLLGIVFLLKGRLVGERAQRQKSCLWEQSLTQVSES
jgi:hypothetical protein